MSSRRAIRVRRAGLALILAGLFAAIVAPAAFAAPRPAWSIAQTSLPTVFAPGDTAEGSTGTGSAPGVVPLYTLTITNVGGVASGGEITVADTLPAGLEPSAAHPAEVRNLTRDKGFTPCTAAGQVVTCHLVGASAVVPPTGVIAVAVPVNIVATGPGTVTNRIVAEGGGAVTAVTSLPTAIGTGAPTFGFQPGSQGLSGMLTDADGAASTQAGSHPVDMILEAGIPTKRISGVQVSNSVVPVGELGHLSFQLPEGMVVDPRATAVRCTAEQLVNVSVSGAEGCPLQSQVGTISFRSAESVIARFLSAPLYNVVPPPGVPAEFGLNAVGTVILIRGGLTGDFRLTGAGEDILAKLLISNVQVSFWGNPTDATHDTVRQGSGGSAACKEGPIGREGPCPVPRLTTPLLTTPTSCSAPLAIDAQVASWEEPGVRREGSTTMTGPAGEPVHLEGCNALEFGPTISSKATTSQPESPSGLDFGLHQPQNLYFEGRANANLKAARVTLPEGMTLNPAAAGGLDACSEEQMGYQPTEGKIRFVNVPQTCPNASKVGTLEATTPLLEEQLPGAIYVAKPFENPFGSLLAIYLAVESEKSGVIVKLAGKVEPDPTTGRLTASFDENPDLPLEDITLHFFSGARGVLTTPLTCGNQVTGSTLTPWSTPEGADAHPSDFFQTTGACASSEAAATKDVSFVAGTVSPLSGAYSPFVLRISRPDASQHITGIETTLPEGLLGKLAGVPYCPESGIAQARSREAVENGKEEIASPSCPAASEVGTVHVTAGSGIAPFPVSGHAYLAGPYKGAPFSFVFIVPAVAGPFDLGTVVDRAAVYVGEYDARPRAVADPLPTIRDGIPLDVRSIEVKLDRPSFMLNPTSCEAMAIEGSVSTQAGQSAPLKNRFQVGECGRLAFKPSLKLSLKGATKRTGHPALKAVVTYPQQGEYANIARAQVSLPHSEFLDQGNIGKSCTKPVLAAGACPAKSIYGKVKAWTPLLEKPLEGPVYLVGGYGYKLPALVAELNGQIRVLLVGKVDTDKQHGIRNTFEAVPDAPVSRFVLEMKGGKKYGLLENSENICRKKQMAGVAFSAQNGRAKNLSIKIANSCGKGSRRHHKKGHGHHRTTGQGAKAQH